MARTSTKTEDTNINEKDEELKKVSQERDNLAELIKQMQMQMNEMQKQIDKNSTPNIVVEQTKVVSRKAKVISLIQNFLILSTEEMGAGRVFKFPKYGDSNTIKLDDLDKILSIPAYRKQAEKGIFYICDADIVEELGLTEEYEKLNDKKAIDSILELNSEMDVDRFLGMSKMMQESTATKMAENINQGKYYDRNLLAKISRNSNFNIEKMAEDLKRIE